MNARCAWTLLGFGILPVPLAGQGVAVGAARWLTSPRVSEYRVGFEGFSFGPFSYRPMLQYLRQGGTSLASWGGAGADLILRTTPSARPYLIGGAALGMGRDQTGGGIAPGIGAWGGVGAELLSFGPMALQAEALYTWRSQMRVESISLGLRIGAKLGRERAESRPLSAPLAPLPSPSATDEETIRRATSVGSSRSGSPSNPGAAAAVVSTALAAMGTPYRWGGAGPEGFDCSGLIQYAYAQHGIELPRRSVEQAHAGSEVPRELGQLLPGDILTFASDPGGEVAHVGLYLGDGEFIHSANGGVQVGQLSAADAAGAWWWNRWVGARRVLQ